MRAALLLILLLASSTFALEMPMIKKARPQVPTASVDSRPPIYQIDNFDGKTLSEKRPWWVFGNLKAEMQENPPIESRVAGPRSLRLKGKTSEWVIGGIGSYLGMDIDGYNALKVLIFGNGPASGDLVFELYDDDNRNWKLELDDTTQSIPVADDKLIYTLKVDWTGWKWATLPLADFRDDNPKSGDDKWNPDQKDGSGGLLQMQVVVFADELRGKVDIKLDSIRILKASLDELTPE